MPVPIEEIEKLLNIWDSTTISENDDQGWFNFSTATDHTDLNESEIDPGTLKNILLLLRKIETPGVRGDQRVRKQSSDDTKPYAELAIAAAKNVLASLHDGNGPLKPEHMAPIVQQTGLSYDDIDTVKKLLSTLGHIQLTRRSGAVSLPQSGDDSVVPDTAVSDSASARTTDRESKLYQSAYQVIYEKLNFYENQFNVRTVDFRVGITGGNGGILRKNGSATTRSGKYLTPDVVAYHIVASESALYPVLRVYTVEVKLVLTLEGVAEAVAHRRFAHNCYVMTPEPWLEIDDSLKNECAKHGIGIISPSKQNSRTFRIQIEAHLNRPDETEIDALLRDIRLPDENEPANKIQFSEEVGNTIRDELLRQVFAPTRP